MTRFDTDMSEREGVHFRGEVLLCKRVTAMAYDQACTIMNVGPSNRSSLMQTVTNDLDNSQPLFVACTSENVGDVTL